MIMTGEERKALALEYIKRLDRGDDFFALFDEHAEVYFPKWGVAQGRDQICQLFADVGAVLAAIKHHYAYFNYIGEGDTLVVEGTSEGQTASGAQWRAGVGHGGRWCDVFEIRNGLIQRLYIYTDPDYWGADTSRYPWLS
ncbi:MAG: nuclear transport factor 2 family protein [Pseudomonadales bacterium]|nr:nuclear transport factor 2 family protein [Pseudomonadales bacterium]